MSTRLARIYKSPVEEADVIGFSRSAEEAVHNPRFETFFDERGYSIKIMPMLKKYEGDTLIWYWGEPERLPENGVSYTYVEVQPPLSDEHLQQFGHLCCRGEIGEEPIIDGYHSGVAVIDNRHDPVDMPVGCDVIIATG